MGLFKRVGDNIRANINALLDKAEDPVKMLNQYLRDMEDDIADAEGAVAKQLAVARKFKAQYEDSHEMSAKREGQALEALKKDREDLARKALEDKKLHSSKAKDYQALYEDSYATANRLKSQLREMKDEYDRLKAKRDNLAARAQAAKAQKEIYGLMGGLSRDSARLDFDRMEEKVLQMEAEAQVASDSCRGGKSLDEELASLGDRDIDRELEDLKLKLKENNAGN
ncbi:MAG: PspA/IM30 family protein [Bacillota bacterium]